MDKSISIIIPVRNEGAGLAPFLQALQPLRKQAEIIIVDGNSTDQTYTIATPLCDLILSSQPGRAQQMNTGAQQASTSTLLFLHADTYFPDHALKMIKTALQTHDWGRFNIQLSGAHFMFRIIETCINLRSRISNVATGDQAIFVKKAAFKNADGYPDIPLMEDVALSKKLRKQSSAACIKTTATTSSRRWEKNGIFTTILLMWQLRFAYFLGVSPSKLARIYYPQQ